MPRKAADRNRQIRLILMPGVDTFLRACLPVFFSSFLRSLLSMLRLMSCRMFDSESEVEEGTVGLTGHSDRGDRDERDGRNRLYRPSGGR